MILKIPKEQKSLIIEAVQQYFKKERDEEIGDLATELLIDFMMEQIRPLVYNQAISDAQAILGQKMVSLEEDMDALKIPVKRR